MMRTFLFGIRPISYIIKILRTNAGLTLSKREVTPDLWRDPPNHFQPFSSFNPWKVDMFEVTSCSEGGLLSVDFTMFSGSTASCHFVSVASRRAQRHKNFNYTYS